MHSHEGLTHRVVPRGDRWDAERGSSRDSTALGVVHVGPTGYKHECATPPSLLIGADARREPSGVLGLRAPHRPVRPHGSPWTWGCARDARDKHRAALRALHARVAGAPLSRSAPERPLLATCTGTNRTRCLRNNLPIMEPMSPPKARWSFMMAGSRARSDRVTYVVLASANPGAQEAVRMPCTVGCPQIGPDIKIPRL